MTTTAKATYESKVNITEPSNTATAIAITSSDSTSYLFVSSYDSTTNNGYISRSLISSNSSLVSFITTNFIPYDMVITDYIYVSTSNGTIVKNDVTTREPKNGSNSNNILISGLSNPRFITISDDGNYLYVSDYDTNRIHIYNANSGTPIMEIDGLSSPTGIAVVGNNLYVANYGTNTIDLYDATTGSIITKSLISNLNGPYDISISDNYLCVTNFTGGTIGMYYATSGVTINNNLIAGLKYPVGISFIDINSLFILNQNPAEYDEYSLNITTTEKITLYAQYTAKFYKDIGETDEITSESTTGSASASDPSIQLAFEDVNNAIIDDIHKVIQNLYPDIETNGIPLSIKIEIDYSTTPFN
jgi:hypothetical protein